MTKARIVEIRPGVFQPQFARRYWFFGWRTAWRCDIPCFTVEQARWFMLRELERSTFSSRVVEER